MQDKIYLVTAEHQTVAGVVTVACATRNRAVLEAMSLANIMLKDAGRMPVHNETAMEAAIWALQDDCGAAHCYVEISEHEVI